jgi:HAMP domain-containing protein
MLLLFLFIPLILTAGLSLFYLWQFASTSHLIVQESSKIVTQLAQEEIASAATATAMMQSQAKVLTDKARMIASMMLGATLLLIGIIVFIYVHRLTGKIKSLSEVAGRISVGELEMEIETKSRDEIGELAEAIARMQDNIRLSIERLRRRR